MSKVNIAPLKSKTLPSLELLAVYIALQRLNSFISGALFQKC